MKKLFLLLLLPSLSYGSGIFNPGSGTGGGGGSSPLEVFVGSARSSPTASITANPDQFNGSVSGSTFTFSLDSSSVTLQGNAITFSSLQTQITATGVSTGSLQTQITATGVSTGSLQTQITATGVSTGSLQTQITATGVSTGSLQTQIAAISLTTASLKSDILAVGLTTASLQTQITATGVSTGSLQTQITATGVSTGSIQSQVTTLSGNFPVKIGSGTVGPQTFDVSATSVSVNGVDGLYVKFGVTAGSMTGAGLGSCGDGTHALSWSGGQFGCQAITSSGGGGSSLAVTTGTISTYSNPAISSPTAVIVLNQNLFRQTVTGTTTFIGLDSSSVTLQGNSITFSSLQTQITATGVSTGSLQTQVTAMGVSTGSLQTQITATGVSTGSLQTQVNALGVSTGSLQTQITATGVSTGSLQTQITATALSTQTLATLEASYRPVSLSTGVVGSLPATSIAAGTLGATVVASSITNASIVAYESALEGVMDLQDMQGAVTAGQLPADGYASTYVNVTGDTMSGQMTNTSSVTVTGADGLRVTYGAILGSATVSDLPSDRCVQTTTGGRLTVAAGVCGTPAGGGGDSLGSHVATMTVTANYGITGTTLTTTGIAKHLGGIYLSSNPITAAYTAVSTDTVILASAPVLGLVVTLPNASNSLGQILTITKVNQSTYPVTIMAASGDLIAGTTGAVYLNAFGQTDTMMATGGLWIPYGAGIQTTPDYVGPGFQGTTANTINVASAVICGSFLTDVPVAIDSVTVHVGTVSDRIALGIYDNAGNRLGTSGFVPANAAGRRNVALTEVLNLPPGFYWECIATTSLTGTFFSATGTTHQFAGYQSCANASAGGLPATLPFPCGTTTRLVNVNLWSHIAGGGF